MRMTGCQTPKRLNGTPLFIGTYGRYLRPSFVPGWIMPVKVMIPDCDLYKIKAQMQT